MPHAKYRKRIRKSVELCFFITLIGTTVIAGSWFTLSKVDNYEERAEDGNSSANSKNISAFSIKSFSDCQHKKSNAEKNRCYESVKGVLDSRVPVSDLLAQNTVAQATKGLLWIGAIQSIVAMVTVGFLMWTVFQTSRILHESRKTTKAAKKSLKATKKTTKAAISTLKLERPKIFIDKIQIMERTDYDSLVHKWPGPCKPQYRIELVLKNQGRSVATKVNSIMGFHSTGDGDWRMLQLNSNFRNIGGLPPSGEAVVGTHIDLTWMYGEKDPNVGFAYPSWKMLAFMTWCRVIYQDFRGDRYMEIIKMTGGPDNQCPSSMTFRIYSHEEIILTKNDPESITELAEAYPDKTEFDRDMETSEKIRATMESRGQLQPREINQ